MIGNRRRLCPFVDQAELVDRMHHDLVRLRGGLRVRVASYEDELAARLADGWISETLTRLSGAKATVEDLQLLVSEWQLHRKRFFSPDDADVIVVEG